MTTYQVPRPQERLIWCKWDRGPECTPRYISCCIRGKLLEENGRSAPAYELAIYAVEQDVYLGKIVFTEAIALKDLRDLLTGGLRWQIGYLVKDKGKDSGNDKSGEVPF